MMALDAYNVLDRWPLENLGGFMEECERHSVREIYLTGTNTDPMLFRHCRELREALAKFTLGVRTNGVAIMANPERWECFDKASITICSLNPDVYRRMMGHGDPPPLKDILAMHGPSDIKINIVLGPENTNLRDGCVQDTLNELSLLGIKRVNLREPYGQPHVGDPLAYKHKFGFAYGMPVHWWNGMMVTYWDVHYCEVESVNLYANGGVSIDYPITRGHSENGFVKEQALWNYGRHNAQWV